MSAQVNGNFGAATCFGPVVDHLALPVSATISTSGLASLDAGAADHPAAAGRDRP